MQIISLGGNKEDNYYQLGLKDRTSSNEIFHLTSSLTKTTNSFTRNLKNISSSLIFKKNFSNYSLVKAYAEGLGKPESEVISIFLTPDLISSMNSFTSNFPSIQFGCSSLFFKNEENNLSHLRILDFPLGDSYTKNERFIKYSFKGEQKYCGFSTSGFPFPAITGMNESGLTFALHQKFGHIFNKNGTPIFDIMENLISQARDIKDILSEIKKIKSISTWGIHIGSIKENSVLSIDLLGEKYNFENTELNEGTLYFNNTFLNKNIDIDFHQPFNFNNFCEERQNDAKKRIKSFKSKTSEEILKNFTSLTSETNQALVITPSSLLSCVMEPDKSSICYNSGLGPRTFQHQINKIINIWSAPKLISTSKTENLKTNKLNNIYHHLIMAQNSWDIKDYHLAVHHAQMAKSLSSPDLFLPSFFLETFISLSTNDMAMLKNCLKNFIELKNNVEDIFKDYCSLFIFRLEKICFGEFQEPNFQNGYIAKIFDFERNIPKLIFKKVTRELTCPRLDIQDIIFLHPLKNDNPRVAL